ncbi:hypothetical protein Tco_1264886 [Tanacetum coccineum]
MVSRNICPILPNQEFVALPSEEELLSFIKELGYSGKCNMLSAIHTDQMHHPWRTFAAIINRFISGKTTGLDRLRESRAQILWGMYNQENVDSVALLWEDFMHQADNKEISLARKEHMPYPRFTKVIIDHFISKDKTISMRNIINLHTVRDDSLLGTLKFVFKTDDTQKCGALIPDEMINQNIKDSKAYKTYYDFDTGKVEPKKARKFKKVASPSIKLSPILEAEPVKKAKRVKRHAKKSTTTPTSGVVIKDSPGVSVSKKKAPAKGDKDKGIELLSNATLLEAAQVKEALQKSKKDSYMLHASGSGDGVGSQLKVPDESKDKTTGTDEETGTKPGVTDVPIYESDSDNESWGDSKDESDDINDDDNDDDNANDDDSENKYDDGNGAHDSEQTDSDDDNENPSFTLKDFDEEEHDEEYESGDDNENVYEEEDDDLYKDVDVRSLGAEYEKERKGDKDMTDADQNTESSKQSSSVSSAFASKFLILDNVPPVVDEVASMMNVKNLQEESSTQAPSFFTIPETAIPETSTTHTKTVPPTISMITPLLQLTTPSPTLKTVPTTTSIPALPEFSSIFGFDQRVSTLERELSQLKQADHSAQLLESAKSQIPTIADDLLSIRIRYATRIALQSYTKEFEKKAQEERKLYIDVVEKSVKDIIKDESTINESLENVILAKSSSQPKSTYEETTSLTEFELKKILLDKIEKSKSYQAAPEHRELYDGLVKSYNLDKDLFSSYGNVYSLKRDREDKDKDEDHPAGSNQGLKKRKMSKDAKPPKGSKSKESKTSSSKGIKSQPKSSGKSMQANKPVFEAADIEMPQDQGGDIEDQPNVEATPMDD